MRKRSTLAISAPLLSASLAALAAACAECAAQTGADSIIERLSLSAAIEEARRSPFHAWAATESPGPSASRIGIAAATASGPVQPGPPERFAVAPVIGLTFLVSGASHLAATYMFVTCALDTSANPPSAARCVLAPIVPLVAVPVPALLAGTHTRRAFGASLIGLLASGVAYYGAMRVTEAIDNANFWVSAAASSIVHAGIVSAMAFGKK